jgi:hypothetical protein
LRAAGDHRSSDIKIGSGQIMFIRLLNPTMTKSATMPPVTPRPMDAA